jgi:hypothetical protein
LNLKEELEMNVGDRIKFSFGGTEKEGVVVKVFPKKVYLKVDFPKHPGKTVVRSLAELEGKKKEKPKKQKKEKKGKAPRSKEKKSEENKA